MSLTQLHSTYVCGVYVERKQKKNSESLHVIEGVSEEAPFHDYFCGYLLSFLPHLFFLSLRLVLESESYSAVAQSLTY